MAKSNEFWAQKDMCQILLDLEAAFARRMSEDVGSLGNAIDCIAMTIEVLQKSCRHSQRVTRDADGCESLVVAIQTISCQVLVRWSAGQCQKPFERPFFAGIPTAVPSSKFAALPVLVPPSILSGYKMVQRYLLKDSSQKPGNVDIAIINNPPNHHNWVVFKNGWFMTLHCYTPMIRIQNSTRFLLAP